MRCLELGVRPGSCEFIESHLSEAIGGARLLLGLLLGEHGDVHKIVFLVYVTLIWRGFSFVRSRDKDLRHTMNSFGLLELPEKREKILIATQRGAVLRHSPLVVEWRKLGTEGATVMSHHHVVHNLSIFPACLLLYDRKNQ
jgi:hypothetical protein